MSNISPEVHNYFKLEFLLQRSYDPIRTLFKNRYSLFTGGQLWDDTPTCGTNYFNNVIKKNKKISLLPVQQTSVKDGNIKQWDLSTFLNIMKYAVRPTTLNSTEIQELDEKNILLEQLSVIRNELSHRSSTSYSNNEFNQLWTDLRTILVLCGDSNTEIDKLKDVSIFYSPSEEINEDNAEEAKRFKSLGTQAYENGQFSEAITYFTKATVLSGVPTVDRAIHFSNMAASRLALYKQQAHCTQTDEIASAKDERYLALKHAKDARRLRPTWWKGHLRVGRVYVALNELEKAIHSFERAWAFDPTNEEVKKALNETRLIFGRQQRQEHLDPESKPESILAQLTERQQRLGLNPEEVRKIYQLFREKNPSLADVEKGYKYEYGDKEIKQSYEEAARCFEKAARQGNAEGMYNLARLIDRGLGVEKDHNRAQKLYEQAAEQLPYHSELYDVRNNGVAEAEHALGLRWAEGVVVAQNLAAAASYHKRAFDHGSVQSGNSLALLYENGSGVIRDLDRAEQIFEQAAEQGNSNAMFNLATLLTSRAKFEKAKIWYDRACKAGHIVAHADTGFEPDLQAKHHLLHSFSPDVLSIKDKIFELYSSVKSTTSASTLTNKSDLHDYTMLLEHANRGSKTARILCDALEHFIEAFYTFTHNETLTEIQENLIIHHLSECYRIQDIVAWYPSAEMRDKLRNLVDRVLRRCNDTVSQLDEETRLCYASLHLDSPKQLIHFLSLCKQKYPKSICFFGLSAAMNGFLGQFDITLYEANLGLEIDPQYCELLYDKAGALRFLEKYVDEAIEAYRAFLFVAPEDHRKVPDSYYAMAMCYMMKADVQGLENAKKMYQKGVEAEKLQLPCFLPYDPSIKAPAKHQLDLMFSIMAKMKGFP